MTTAICRAALALLVCIALAACAPTIDGTPTSGPMTESPEFDKLLQECDAVSPEEIAETVGGGSIERYFLGAVCMWQVRTPSGLVDVTFAWFENNTVSHEREVAGLLGYTVSDVKVVGSSGFAARRAGPPESCGVTIAYSGVITWWVQAAALPDPCEVARKLAELTLNRNV